MEREPFKIVFQKVAELGPEEDSVAVTGAIRLVLPNRDAIEATEISELRRLALELSEPEAKYFTGT